MNGNTLHMGGGFRTIVRVSGGRLAREEWWEWPSQTAETSVCTVHQLETSYSFLQCIRWATVYHPYTVYGYAIDIHKYTQKRSKISEHRHSSSGPGTLNQASNDRLPLVHPILLPTRAPIRSSWCPWSTSQPAQWLVVRVGLHAWVFGFNILWSICVICDYQWYG